MRIPKITNRLILLAFACALLLLAEHRAPAQSTKKNTGPQPVLVTNSVGATQSGTWNVGINNTTEIAFQETRDVGGLKIGLTTTTFGPIDVSPYRTVRFAVQVPSSDSPSLTVTVRSLLNSDSFQLETMNGTLSSGTRTATDVLDSPGTSILLDAAVDNSISKTAVKVKVGVWGRSN